MQKSRPPVNNKEISKGMLFYRQKQSHLANGSSRWICPAASMLRCTSLACTRGGASGRGFLLKSYGIGSILAGFFETCTSKRRSVDDYMHMSDLCDYHVRMPVPVR